MKFFRVNDNIINLAAVRNIERKSSIVFIYFLNPTVPSDYLRVSFNTEKEAKEGIDILFDMMGKSDEEKTQRNY